MSTTYAPSRPSSSPPPQPLPAVQQQSGRAARALAAATAAALAPPAATHEVLAPQPGGCRDAQLRAYEARHAEAMVQELRRGAEELASRGAFAAAEALYTEALLFEPGAANLLAARAGVRAKDGRAADALADAKAAVQAAPSWPRGHACLALALQAAGKLGPAADAMQKAAWLARVSDGDADGAAQYKALAEQLRRRKGALLFDDDTVTAGGLFGDAAPLSDAAVADAQRRAAGDEAAALEARLRALEGDLSGGVAAAPQAPPLAQHTPPPQATPPSLRRFVVQADALAGPPRSLPPGGWQPPPLFGPTRPQT